LRKASSLSRDDEFMLSWRAAGNWVGRSWDPFSLKNSNFGIAGTPN
jgi:hypothetical protein